MQSPHLAKFGQSGFHELHEQAILLQKDFNKRLQQAFPLIKRFEQEADDFDVKTLIGVLKSHALFGKSFQDDLKDLYNLLKRAEKCIKTIEVLTSTDPKTLPFSPKRADADLRRSRGTLKDLKESIKALQEKIDKDLEKGHNELTILDKKLRFLWSSEDQLAELLADVQKKMEDKLGKKFPKNMFQTMTGQLHGALHDMTPLFSAVAQGYANEFDIVKKMIKHEVDKITDFMAEDLSALEKNLRTPPVDIDFSAVLSHVQLVQNKLDRTIATAKKLKDRKEQLAELSKIEKQILHALLIHKELPARMQAKIDRYADRMRKISDAPKA